MNNEDLEIIKELMPVNPRLTYLYKTHLKLEKEIASVERYDQLSTNASLKTKELKKIKLRGKEMIMMILEEYKVYKAKSPA